MCKLIKLDDSFYHMYKEMMDEWRKSGSRIAPWFLDMKCEDEEDYKDIVKRVKDVEDGINLGEYAASSSYLLYDKKEDCIIGASNLRHKIIGKSGNLWGHIGFGIRPSKRNKGYATKLLELTLEEAKKRGIKHVYASAYIDNVGSCKTLEKCGFEYEETLVDEECSKEVKKYCYSFRKKFAYDLKQCEDIPEIAQQIKSVNNDDFTGDIVLHSFIKVANPIIVGNGICMMDTGYKWLEFYDYNSKNRLTAMYDNNGDIVEWYYDISRKIGKENESPYEDDLYLDIVITSNGKQIVLDEDELEEAFKNDEICEKDYEMAYDELKRLLVATKDKSNELKKFTDKYLELFK